MSGYSTSITSEDMISVQLCLVILHILVENSKTFRFRMEMMLFPFQNMRCVKSLIVAVYKNEVANKYIIN